MSDDRRPQHSGAPPRGRGENGGGARELGRSRGGWGSKLPLITERGGKPIVVALTEGQRHESPEAIPLLERATERRWPAAVAGDQGYSGAELRNWLLPREIEAVIPSRADAMGCHDYNRALYRERSLIECPINRLKRFRRIATRYEQLATSYLAMVPFAMMLEWL